MRESPSTGWILIHVIFYFIPQLTTAATFLLGVDVFLNSYAHLVKGQKVGLITNHTGKNRAGSMTIDLLYNHPDIDLVVLFAPEHGIRGTQKAGEKVARTKDTKTGLPIFSLYSGNDHRPPKIALNIIDTLIYDIQDVGSRAYTYIWSMAEAMAAAGESRKKFIVLDRPNPMSCNQLDGPITEKKWLSFIGLYPIPRVYGMTVGELARYLNGEHQLNCHLTIIPMAAYTRKANWEDIQMPWTPPSPNIPSLESARCFPATGTIGVLGNVHIGIGTRYPFQIFGATWLDNVHAANYLNQCGLPGINFMVFEFKSTTGLFKGKNVRAVKLNINNINIFLPARTEIHILNYLQRFYSDKMKWVPEKINAFDKAMGTSSVRIALLNGYDVESIIRLWEKDLALFRAKIRPYLIYH